jgi:sugar (pentulose or hexulose) kinase
VFCQELAPDEFFASYVPAVIADFFNSSDLDSAEQEIPDFTPYLQGSRYSLESLKAGFQDITLQTSRELFLLSILRGNEIYHADHLKELAKTVAMGKSVIVTGGEARIPGMLAIKQRWLGDYDYSLKAQSSLFGAAQLAFYLEHGSFDPVDQGSVPWRNEYDE